MKTFVSSPPAQGGQRWPKLTLATAVVLALFFSAVGTSDAQTERVRSQQVDQVRPAPIRGPVATSCSVSLMGHHAKL